MNDTGYEVIDTLRFQTLVDEAKRSLQQEGATWTDHNVSDPGITLLETLAYLIDALSYRASHIPKNTVQDALKSLMLTKKDSPSRTVTLSDLKEFERTVNVKVEDSDRKEWWATCTDSQKVTKGEHSVTFLLQAEGGIEGAREKDYTAKIKEYFANENKPLVLGLDITSQPARMVDVTVTVTYAATDESQGIQSRIETLVREFMGLPRLPVKPGSLIVSPWAAGRSLYADDIYNALRDDPAKIVDVRLQASMGDDQYVPLEPDCAFRPTVVATPDGKA